MDKEPQPANPETLQSILNAARSFLEIDGFLLNDRTVYVPADYVDDYDIAEVSVARSADSSVLMCHVRRPSTPETPVRYEAYHIHSDGTIKNVVVEVDYTDDELNALYLQEVTEAEWLDELVRLDMEGVLDEDEERARVNRILRSVDDLVRRLLVVRSLLNSSVTEEERTEARHLLDAIHEEAIEKQVYSSLSMPFSLDAMESSREYGEYFMRLMDAQFAGIIARARAVYRGVQSEAEQVAQIKGSTLSEAQAWDLLRTFDRVAEF